jgi:hypothetical protein
MHPDWNSESHSSLSDGRFHREMSSSD